ncbi:hypothetical protein [Streptomyces sp. AK02-01A]|uniref:hypothetical protein n=1 Tax=Streptomyces sp. AK02-01A TaxID=3028648 RepID=UPI0029A347ED|nr:hypothetical protein [Streptomyces sp. AK02-01A]MDX3851043.1 hypothetical protein [Streptomyces sp. AK02-01A]
MESAGFETEAEFQKLLARHPRVLNFGSLTDGQLLRLVLVAREMRVPASVESGPAYWLDHLFVDADGVPTLVEVKRASDTRIRREVVGQMLDYAANGARYWPAALLQRSFEETCQADDRSLDEAYGELLGERTPEDFWAAVEERLAAGHMRLLFVANRIPLELRAIVEFLNRRMRQTEVYAVELTQYRGGGDLRVLVPRVPGHVATAAKSPSDRRNAPKTSRAAIVAAPGWPSTPDSVRPGSPPGKSPPNSSSYPGWLAPRGPGPRSHHPRRRAPPARRRLRPSEPALTNRDRLATVTSARTWEGRLSAEVGVGDIELFGSQREKGS